MTSTPRTLLAVGSSVAVLSASLLLAPTASANDADVIRTGNCSGRSDWKLKAKPDDGRLEVEGEVDSNQVGQTWNWRILHNGSVSARGSATTTGPSGSFDVERRVSNLAGSDSIGWRARNPRTGETCSGRLSI